MKNFISILLVCFSFDAFAQMNLYKHTQEKYTSFKGDTSLNSRLFMYFDKNIKWENYDTLCLLTVVFVKFNAGNKKVSGIKFSDSELPFLNTIIEKALLSTAKFWEGKSDEVYFLPFVISFENHCHPDISAGNVLQMLKPFSGEPNRYTLPGDEDYKPLKCTILNAYFIKSHWE